MKLRLRNNSIRLRLTKGDLQRLSESGQVAGSVDFGSRGGRLAYTLVSVDEDTLVRPASLSDEGITICVARMRLTAWLEGGKAGIEAEQQTGDGGTLQIVIEKDFTCLKPRPGGEDTDTFPHPDGEAAAT